MKTGVPLPEMRKGAERRAAGLFNAVSSAWSAFRHRGRREISTSDTTAPAALQRNPATAPYRFHFDAPRPELPDQRDPPPAADPLPIDSHPVAEGPRATDRDDDTAPVAAEMANPVPPVDSDASLPNEAEAPARPMPSFVPLAPDAAQTTAQTTDTAAAPVSLPQALPDPELDALRDRVARMEERVLELEARKRAMDALLDEHAYRQYQVLGDLLREQLQLRQEVLRLRAERSQSEDDLQAAAAAAEECRAYEAAARGTPPAAIELAEDEEAELKALYRAAAMRCHPDRVAEAEKPRAHEFFLRCQQAYRNRDVEALRQIDRQLGSDETLSRAADAPGAAARLNAFLQALEDKGVELAMAIHQLQSETRFRMARQRERWEDQFAELRVQIEGECAVLRREIARY